MRTYIMALGADVWDVVDTGYVKPVVLAKKGSALIPIVGQLRGGVNQLLPCLNNYGSFKIFTGHSMMITMMGNKQRHIQHQSHI